MSPLGDGLSPLPAWVLAGQAPLTDKGHCFSARRGRLRHQGIGGLCLPQEKWSPTASHGAVGLWGPPTLHLSGYLSRFPHAPMGIRTTVRDFLPMEAYSVSQGPCSVVNAGSESKRTRRVWTRACVSPSVGVGRDGRDSHDRAVGAVTWGPATQAAGWSMPGHWAGGTLRSGGLPMLLQSRHPSARAPQGRGGSTGLSLPPEALRRCYRWRCR